MENGSNNDKLKHAKKIQNGSNIKQLVKYVHLKYIFHTFIKIMIV